MSPSRLAFVWEFEQQLESDRLREWFARAHQREVALQDFRDAGSLRRFLHSEAAAGNQKPEIWRVLVRCVQRDRTPEAVVFVLGLLEPALGKLTDDFEGSGLNADDLWQETVACALQALANPRLTKRGAVLAGIVWDTFKHLCPWLENELEHFQRQVPLLEAPYEPDLDADPEWSDDKAALAYWGRRAGIAPAALDLILATRLGAKRLSQLANPKSAAYHRLHHARKVAERRLQAWLLRRMSFGR